MRSFPLIGILSGALLAAGLAACEGCRSTPVVGPSNAADAGPPTVRLYLVSNLAGAIEPCGCTKDQLGGVDHFAAWVASERPHAPASAVVAAGPLFFMDPKLAGDRKDQDIEKAHALARSLKDLGLVAFAPADNDWDGGPQLLGSLADEAGATVLLANGGDAFKHGLVREIGGVKIGFVGVGSAVPPGAQSVEDAVRATVADLKEQGAKVLVALASVGRGQAKRIADAVPELALVLVGATMSGGESNTTAPPAERIGNVLIAETANHLQGVAVFDLYVKDGSFTFADASGIERSRQREELTRRIDDLRVRISNWERDGKVEKRDLDARRDDLAKLEAEREKLSVLPPPARGSFFRYTTKEIREALGKDPAVSAELLAYYKKVDDANKAAFADRLPRPVSPGQASYIGIDACTKCHEAPRKVWDATRHAHAYATLVEQFKEFNLDCVSCHVTGYEAPGGSTVTHVEKLKDVECEVCHGPGSKHAQNTSDKGLLVGRPTTDVCLGCHHPPHVEQFDAAAKMQEILGPGHGRPL
jgi:cytochrome c554/c'-like protein